MFRMDIMEIHRGNGPHGMCLPRSMSARPLRTSLSSAREARTFSIHVDRERLTPFIARQVRSDQEHTFVRARQRTLGAIMNSLIEAGLRGRRIEEHPDLFWNQFANMSADSAARLPRTFSLLMEKA
jgi:hypothetical protein